MPRPAEIRPIRPGLWAIETAVEDFDVRSLIVAGHREALVWDTLAHPSHMSDAGNLVPELPHTVVYSHGDWDHVWGTAGLSRPWTQVVAHEACLHRFREELPGTLAQKRSEGPKEFDGVKLIPPSRTFSTHLTLDLGGVTVELYSVPGHTPDSIVGWIPDWNVLLAGDAVECPLPFLNTDSHAGPWAASLERWADRMDGAGPPGGVGVPDPENLHGPGSAPPLVIPSHGPLGGSEILRSNARYLRALLGDGQPELPRGLSPFYTKTHASNLKLAGSRGP